MEKAKPSKKQAYSRNRKMNAQPSGNEPLNRRRTQPSESSRCDKNVTEDKETFAKRSLQQPESRLAKLDEIWQETHVGQDFETLVNVPLSADGHFIFKSEKNWALDASKYDDFFSIDVKNLTTIISCIPYNHYVEVDNEYFTKDELTDINNTAEQGKRVYDLMLESLKKKGIENTADRTSAQDSSKINDSGSTDLEKGLTELGLESKGTEEDLDFLLSLKEPVRSHPVAVAPPGKNASKESKTNTVPAATKSIDLEKWLDSVLED